MIKVFIYECSNLDMTLEEYLNYLESEKGYLIISTAFINNNAFAIPHFVIITRKKICTVQ